MTLNTYVTRRFKPNLNLKVYPDPVIFPELSPSHTFSTNAYGFRALNQTSLEKVPDAMRIMFLGGSTTECSLLDDRKTWPHVASRAAEVQSGRRLRIEDINTAVAGTHTRDHLGLLSQYLIPFKPDAVVILAGINDLFLHLRKPYSPLRQDMRSHVGFVDWAVGSDALDVFHTVRFLKLLKDGHLAWTWRGPRAAYHVGDFISQRRLERTQVPYQSLPNPERYPLPEFEQNMRSLIGIAQANDAKVVLVTQQWLYDEYVPATAKAKFWIHGGDFLYAENVMDALLSRYNAVTRKLAREFGTGLVDLEDHLPKEEDFFYDEMHFTTQGAQQVANLVAPALAEMLATSGNSNSNENSFTH